METTILTTTCILIALGVLIKRFPQLIAGYNTMSKEEKKSVDIKGLSTFMCYSFVGMGIIPLLFFYICLGIGHADWAGLSSIIPILYLPYLIYKANTFDHNTNKRSRKYIVALSILTVVIISLFMINGINPSTVKIKQNEIVFTGMFGTSKSLNSLISMRLSDSLPHISRRLNGLSIGGINKGKFSMENGNTCLMFLSSTHSPYIVFQDKDGREIFYNARSKDETIELYQQLSDKIPTK